MASYVTGVVTLKTNKKTSKVVGYLLRVTLFDDKATKINSHADKPD